MEDTQDDYTLMRNWLLEPELREWVWYDEKGEPPISLERVIDKYRPRVKNPTDVFPYFILRDNEPIGFIQYYLQNEMTVGLDLWIGVRKERNQGYGSQALRLMVQLIHQKYPNVKEIFIDPDADNKRAIKCYLNAGFSYSDDIIADGHRCLLLKVHF